MSQTLKVKDLRWTLNPKSLDLKTLEKDETVITGKPGALGQGRALSALKLGLGIPQKGYNVFAVGVSGTGRTSTVVSVLKEKALKESVPESLILLYNFSDRDRPWSINLPAGQGEVVKATYEVMVDEMLTDLEKTFESENYAIAQKQIDEAFEDESDDHLEDIEAAAKKEGFILSKTKNSLSLGLAGKDGEPINEEVYDKMTSKEKKKVEERAMLLQEGLEEAIRKIRQSEKKFDQILDNLAKETTRAVLTPIIEKAKESVKSHMRVCRHLDGIIDDVNDRLYRFIPEEGQMDDGDDPSAASPIHLSLKKRLLAEESDSGSDEPTLLRYRVNLLISNKNQQGAPFIFESNPTSNNLLGRIVHKTKRGEVSTDFTCIKAGALYKANGGYLVIDAQDLLREPYAWEALKRSLRTGRLELEDPGEPGRLLTMASLRPEAVPLKIKVCMIGTPELYYALSRTDPDFSKLFKVKVDFDLDMKNEDEQINGYLKFLVGMAHEEGLQPLSQDGAARLIEHAVRISENQEYLSTRFGWIADLLREANFYTKEASPGKKRAKITAAMVRKALSKREEREGFIESRMHEDIAKSRVRIETTGTVVGQINGLTVLDMGRYQFGMPARISCTVGIGKGKITDFERESELGGPFHTKGLLIIRGILQSRFAQEIPLRMSANICMEQSYSHIDGDSASMAETCALFSALSNVPLPQNFAMTGSIDQRGRSQAIGGVNEKIEGFFKVCRDSGNTGPFEVIIPTANAGDLMLSEDVIDAVKKKSFKIHTVDNLEEALYIMTKKKWNTGRNSIEEKIKETLLGFYQASLKL